MASPTCWKGRSLPFLQNKLLSIPIYIVVAENIYFFDGKNIYIFWSRLPSNLFSLIDHDNMSCYFIFICCSISNHVLFHLSSASSHFFLQPLNRKCRVIMIMDARGEPVNRRLKYINRNMRLSHGSCLKASRSQCWFRQLMTTHYYHN
jgi:hypothetical protein